MILSAYDLGWQKEGSEKLFGHQMTIWTATPSKEQMLAQMHTRSERNARFHAIRLWTAEDITLPKPVDTFMNTMNRWPKGQGVPIKSIKYKLRGTTQVMLDTKSFRYVDVPDSVFDLPRGYKPTTNPTDITITRNGIIEDVLDTIGK